MERRVKTVILLMCLLWSDTPLSAQQTTQKDSIMSSWTEAASGLTADMLFENILPKVERYLDSAMGDDPISADIRNRMWKAINYLKVNRQNITDEALQLILPSLTMGIGTGDFPSFVDDSARFKFPDMEEVKDYIHREAGRFSDILKELGRNRK